MPPLLVLAAPLLLAHLAVGAAAAQGVSTEADSGPCAQVVREPSTPAHVVSLVEWALTVHEPRVSDGPDARRAWERTRAFYLARGCAPAWLDDGGLDAARAITDLVRAAADDGLEPSAYDTPGRLEELERRREVPTQPEQWVGRVDADVRFSLSAFRFASDLALGRWGGSASDRSLDLVAVLASVRDAGTAALAFQQLEPVHPEYALLRRQLARYRAIAATGGWPALPETLRLAPGAQPKAAAARAAFRAGLARLRARLAAEGDLHDAPAVGGGGSAAAAPAGTYDAALQAAVRRFQSRHGLPSTGAVDRATISALNVDADTRVRQIALNMDRWRRLPQDLGARHVRVNTPEFTLRLVEGGQPRETMKVVAGEAATPTPVLSDVISYLEFRPYWNVPESIALQMVPKILKDPGYLAARRLEVLEGWDDTARVVPPSKVPWKRLTHSLRPYRLRQKSGDDNALGTLKFMFPNVYSVYLHDTPAREKFLPRERAFSNGCVRVEDPVRLAEFIFAGDGRWSRPALVKAMKTGGRQVVDLATPVPVHLTYFTAWADGGQVHFRPDLYGWDRVELRMPAAGTM